MYMCVYAMHFNTTYCIPNSNGKHNVKVGYLKRIARGLR